jgi:hypothetical protein
MSDKIFDDIIRQKVNDHASPVPGDMWNRIQADNGKRRGLAWWKNPVAAVLIGVGLMGGTWAVYLGLQDGSPHLPTTAKNENIKNGTANVFERKNIKDYENNSRRSTNNSVVNNKEAAEDGNMPAKKSLANNKISINANQLNEESMASKISKKATARSLNVGNKLVADILPGYHTVTPNHNDEAVSETNRLQGFNRSIQNSLSLVAASQKNLSQKKLNEKLLENQKFYGFTECPSAYGNARNDWYIEVFASPDYAFKSTSKGNLPDAYFAKKDSTESFKSAYSAGLRISKNIGENLLLKSGLQYSQINEKFSLRTENEKRLVTVVTIRTIIRSPGDTLVVSDTSTVEQIGYRVRTTYNKYRSLDIPLILGYEWGNENWKGSVNAGVILNLRSWQEGEMLDTSYTAVSFSKSSAQTFKQNIGLGLYAGFSFIKPVTDKMEIFAEPYFRYNISNMTQSKSLFNQKFHSAGINMGVRYKLNNSRQR